MFLLPGGLAWAQDAESIDYPRERDGSGGDVHCDVTLRGRRSPELVAGQVTDASDFMLENGVLRLAKKSPDYETPKGGGIDWHPHDNTYEVMVKATDETPARSPSKTVMVKVTNVDEAGTVTLSAQAAPGHRCRVHREDR